MHIKKIYKNYSHSAPLWLILFLSPDHILSTTLGTSSAWTRIDMEICYAYGKEIRKGLLRIRYFSFDSLSFRRLPASALFHSIHIFIHEGIPIPIAIASAPLTPLFTIDGEA